MSLSSLSVEILPLMLSEKKRFSGWFTNSPFSFYFHPDDKEKSFIKRKGPTNFQQDHSSDQENRVKERFCCVQAKPNHPRPFQRFLQKPRAKKPAKANDSKETETLRRGGGDSQTFPPPGSLLRIVTETSQIFFLECKWNGQKVKERETVLARPTDEEIEFPPAEEDVESH